MIPGGLTAFQVLRLQHVIQRCLYALCKGAAFRVGIEAAGRRRPVAFCREACAQVHTTARATIADLGATHPEEGGNVAKSCQRTAQMPCRGGIFGDDPRIHMPLKAQDADVYRSSRPERREIGCRLIRNRMRPTSTKARVISYAVLLWVALGFGITVAEAASPVRVFAIRGVGGVFFSRGMNALCDELAELVSVTCTVEDFTEVTSIESQARAADAAGAQVVLVGHSMGADAAIEIANEIAGPVALVAAIDPSRFAALPVPVNVAVVLNYYERRGIYGRFFGRGVVSTAEGFNGRITRVERDEPHVLIDRDPEIHSAIIAEIMNLLR